MRRNTIVVATPEQITERMLADIQSGKLLDDDGNRVSEYHPFLLDESSYEMSIKLTEILCESCVRPHYYSLHFIDNIYSCKCKMFGIEAEKGLLLGLVEKIMRENIRGTAKLNPNPYAQLAN